MKHGYLYRVVIQLLADNSSETSDVTGKGRPTKASSDLTANGEKTRNYK